MEENHMQVLHTHAQNMCIKNALTTCGITNLKQEKNVQKYCINVDNEMKM